MHDGGACLTAYKCIAYWESAQLTYSFVLHLTCY